MRRFDSYRKDETEPPRPAADNKMIKEVSVAFVKYSIINT